MTDKRNAIDSTETLLAHLICADSDNTVHTTGAKRGFHREEADAGMIFRFDVMRPKLAHTFDMLSGDRLFATDHRLLVTSVPDILGREAEVAVMKEDGTCQWNGYRRLVKLPRQVWAAGKVGVAYEVHSRIIHPDGSSRYFRRVAAVTPQGVPLACVIQGTRNPAGAINDKDSMTLAASIIEDVGRTGCFTTSVRDHAGVVFPIPYGAQKELFKLRDAPLSSSGRRKAILHWVASHLRRSTIEVKEHTRGVHDFVMDGLKVHLSPNDTERP